MPIAADFEVRSDQLPSSGHPSGKEGQTVNRDPVLCAGNERPSFGVPDPGREGAAGPSPAATVRGSRALRICLVVEHLPDEDPEDEAGAAFVEIAHSLRDAGHDVTVLETGRPRPRISAVTEVPVACDLAGIRRVELPPSPVVLDAQSKEIMVSYRVYLWLREQEVFDLVHFPDRGGPGFYAMIARRQGLALQRTACVVALFGCSAWRRRAACDILRHESELERDVLERRSAEMADVVWSPVRAALDWVGSQGWALPPTSATREMPGGDGCVSWHEEVVRRHSESAGPKRGAADRGQDLPTISVCVTHYNRPHLLRQALASIVEQHHAPLEVIVLDDGSPGEDVQAELDRIVEEFEFSRRGWRLVRQENRYLGAARNAAAREARGEYIFFMDDDNVAKPHELSTFAEVARRTSADVLTCLLDMFEGDERPWADQPPTKRLLFSGAAMPLSVIRNTFGDANSLVRRRALMEIGGFTEDRGAGQEDWEAYSKFALRGYRVEVVPEPLFFYRTAPSSMSRGMPMIRSHLRTLRPYLEEIPRAYHPLIELAMGQLLDRWGLIDPPPPPPPEPEEPPPPLPLRYRIADAINDRVKRLRPMHRMAKRLIELGRSARPIDRAAL